MVDWLHRNERGLILVHFFMDKIMDER